MQRKVEITFESVIRLTPEKREELIADLAVAPASVLGDILIAGARVLLTNAYNSGGKDVPEADRRRNVERRLAAWNRGEYALTNSGPRESIIGEMRDAFISKQVSLGKTAKQAEEMIRNAVTQAFGEKEKATFPRFLDAVATLKAKADGGEMEAIRNALEASAMEAVEVARKQRAEAVAEVTIDASQLF